MLEDGTGGDAPTTPLRNAERGKFRKNQEKQTKTAKTMKKKQSKIKYHCKTNRKPYVRTKKQWKPFVLQ